MIPVYDRRIGGDIMFHADVATLTRFMPDIAARRMWSLYENCKIDRLYCTPSGRLKRV